jgi:hypothetical protein
MTPSEQARTPTADLSEALTGGNGVFLASATPVPDLAAAGWVEVELVAAGVAGSFTLDGEMREDGQLDLAPGETARYRTRVVVRRPAVPSAFSGTVVVEWLNVSSGLDANPDWAFLTPELMRRGVAWVGVSAQCIGVEGGAVLVDAGEGGAGMAGAGLKGLDPARYGSLDHPGDAFAYDIYSQVGAALRSGATAALGELAVEQVLAIGESQSAFALTTYIDGVHPDAWVYDGFLVHSRGRAGLPLGEPGGGITGRTAITGAPLRIRTDLDVPVLVVQTETDLLPVLGFAEARQDDTDLIRLWEIAGTAHADASTLGRYAAMVDCGVPINDGPQRFVLRAALRHLVTWGAGGQAAPAAERLVIDLGPEGARFPRDVDGLARGGIRLPQIEVPVAALSGDPGPVDTLMCQLLGQTVAFTPERLAELYPSVEQYLAAYEAATDTAIADGFALADDRAEILADAHPSVIPT